jgi:hypothetical protein
VQECRGGGAGDSRPSPKQIPNLNSSTQPPAPQVQNTLRQLEAQVEAAAARGAALNVGPPLVDATCVLMTLVLQIDRVAEDLKQVKQENAQLSKLLA